MESTIKKARFTGKYVYIECRNCNTYIKVEEKTRKHKCNKCGTEEELVVINEKVHKEKSK